MKISYRLATPQDAHLPTFDNTKLTAINTCPTWGIMRYTHHKTISYGGRAMALEAGKLMHDCFSVVRLYQLGAVQNLHGLMHYHGVRLFGVDRWNAIVAGGISKDEFAPHHVNARNLCWNVMSTAEWVDDPDDKKRTYAAMEAAIAYYCERWDFARYPVWVRDVRDPKSDVGIEIPFDVVVCIEDTNAETIYSCEQGTIYPTQQFRLTGRIDGIHVDRDGAIVLHENKTGKIDRVWRRAVEMSHQPTGYCVAAMAFTAQEASRGMMIGMSIPLARSVVDSIAYQPIERPQHMLDAWARWAYHTVELHDKYALDVSNAPRYTHSCNRYFRVCSMLPYCTADEAEREYIMADMVVDEWSPLGEEAGE